MVLSKSLANYDDYPEKTQTSQDQKKSTQPLSSGFPRPDNNSSSEKKACKEKKKKYCQEHKKDSGTPATGVNTNDITFGRALKDMSLITYFNCNRTGHYARSYPKPIYDLSKMLKNSCQSRQLLRR